MLILFAIINTCRDVAQLGSALPWGGRGQGFKSPRSDQNCPKALIRSGLFSLSRMVLLFSIDYQFRAIKEKTGMKQR